MDPTEPTEVPAHIGRYALLETLGTGGTSTVHAAVRLGDPELVVLKQLRVEVAERKTARERLRREAEIASLLVHPGIARLLDAGFDEDRLYLVMEYIAGVTFAELAQALFAKGRLVPYAVTLSLGVQVLAALEHAHALKGADGRALNVVHRDLSPSNLMLDAEGRARVIDFGVARVSDDQDMTRPGTVLGTPRYLSPEQARGETAEITSDLYTVAVVLYELLTAQRLTPKGDRGAIIASVLRYSPPPVHEINPRLPEALSPVLQSALHKNPSRRPRSARAMRLALEAAAGPWARVPRDRMIAFIAAHFPHIHARTDVLRQRALEEGGTTRPPDLSFPLFETAQAELHVPTRADALQPQPLGDDDAAYGATRTDATYPEVPDTLVDPSHHDLTGDPVTVVTAVTAAAEPVIVDDNEGTDPEPRVEPILPPKASRPRVRPVEAPSEPKPEPRARPPAPTPEPARPLASVLPPDEARPWLPRAVAVLGALALLGGAYVLGRAQGQSAALEVPLVVPSKAPPTTAPVQAVARPAPPVAPTEAPPVDAGPAPEAATTPAPPEPPKPRPARAKPAPRRTPAAPAAPEPPASAGALSRADLTSLRAQLASLDTEPLDRGGFLRLHSALERHAAKLPKAGRARVALHLSAAERSLDRRELAAALDALSRAEP